MEHTLRTISWIADSGPNNPVFAFRPAALKRAVGYFTRKFHSHILYAVKTNPEEHIIRQLHAEGVRSFDVASLQEIAQVRKWLPDATLFFMHPVKPRHAIREAYFTHGIRHFSFDSTAELDKILEETNHAEDLHLFLRLAIPNTYSEINLGEKFGITLQEAPALLQRIRPAVKGVGVCFHVGSQCMHPDAYRIAMRMTGKVIRESKVEIDYFNVGGGFPSIYPGMVPPAISEYFDAIHSEFDKINKNRKMTLFCEPGRALVAESTSVIVRVDMRKNNMLYINDGTYGSLFDAGTPKFIFPVTLLRKNHYVDSTHLIPFSFYGPTCDSLDFMKGPFYLPKDICEGEYIEIGQMGAYGRTMSTGFNGFGHEIEHIAVSDEPLMTMYKEPHTLEEGSEIIAA